MYTLTDQFKRLTDHLNKEFLDAPEVAAKKWQSADAPQPMVELFNRSFTLDLRGEEDLGTIADVIRPNLPWADRHFEEERVSGEPINPGETWKIWPYARSAAAHLREGENVPQYDHSYAERYWPKYAGMTVDGRLPSDDDEFLKLPLKARGIRFGVGDLSDLVQTLVDDPLTRQAYLPIFFPEDTAAARMGKRVPCTLGYHIIRRPMGNFGDFLHLVYPMRSCDYIRHFRDDVYLTIRLLLWVLHQCQNIDRETWGEVQPGTFRMHITSLHMFRQDRENLRNSMR
jgi:thymidylate synthase